MQVANVAVTVMFVAALMPKLRWPPQVPLVITAVLVAQSTWSEVPETM